MSSTYGNNLKISIFGQSHSPAIGVSIDGIPAGFRVDFDKLAAFTRRRRPGQGAYSTKRTEKDEPEFISGLVGDTTCGAPLAAIIRNTDTHSSDYGNLWDVPRPSHADYTAYAKFGEARDVRGGGAFSGRLTAPLCVAGGICLQLLQRENIYVAAHIARIGNVTDKSFDPVNIDDDEVRSLSDSSFPVLDESAGERMLALIEEVRKAGDSVGGIVECAAIGVPAGIGDPMFDGMENRLASIIFSIPAVKGIEFGNGFSSALIRGSENNDAFIIEEDTIRTRTNRHGGILGGITSGMPLIFRAAFKPTPSISIQQDSVSLSRREAERLSIVGRHDPCILPRAVPCVEAATAIALYDALLGTRGMATKQL